MFAQQANSGHGQQGHRHRGRATNFFAFVSGPTAVTANNKGTDIAGELLIFFVFVSGLTAVTANEGTDITGELLIFLFLSAGQQRSWPTRAQTSQASY